MGSLGVIKRAVKKLLNINSAALQAIDYRDIAFDDYSDAVISTFGDIQEDFCDAILPDELQAKLGHLLASGGFDQSVIRDKISNQESGSNFLILSEHEQETVQVLPRCLRRGWELDCNDRVVIEIHNFIRDAFADYFRSPIAIINSRAWITTANSDRFGPNSLHGDGFPSGHLKVMIYPNGLNDKCGSLILGEEVITDKPAGYTLAFRNSDVLHAGIPGKELDRISVEITLMRSLENIPQYNPSHFNGTVLQNPWIAHLLNDSKSEYLPSYKTKYINVGSGIRDWTGWLLLDALEHPNVLKYSASCTSTIPAEQGTADLIYSSHHIEHVDIPTFDRMIRECSRVVHPSNGVVLLKFPDYDYILENYLNGNENFFLNKGIEEVSWSWGHKGVEDNLANRASMLFCGYWNKQYGDHFSGKINRDQYSYHGPAVMDIQELDRLLRSSTPSAIAERLRLICLEDSEFSCFNHQSAWSALEIETRLNAGGLSVISQDKVSIASRFGNTIPDLLSYFDWSRYVLAKKT